MKDALNKLMKETAVNDVSDKGTIALLLAVLMKYGIAPLVILYFAYVNFQQNDYINQKLTTMIEAQTAATVKNTEVQGQLVRVVENNTNKLEEIEKKK